MKHTPGPWGIFRIDPFVIGEHDNCEPNLLNRVVATTKHHSIDPYYEISDEEARANACLIAAAPELLEACKTVLPFLEEDMPDGPDAEGIEYACTEAYRNAYRLIFAAIKKAEGS